MSFDAMDLTVSTALLARSSRMGTLVITDPAARAVVRRLVLGAGRWARFGGRALDVTTAEVEGAVHAHDGSSFRIRFRPGAFADFRQNKLADAGEIAREFLDSPQGFAAAERAVAWYLRWCADHEGAAPEVVATWQPSGAVVLRLRPVADAVEPKAA